MPRARAPKIHKSYAFCPFEAQKDSKRDKKEVSMMPKTFQTVGKHSKMGKNLFHVPTGAIGTKFVSLMQNCIDNWFKVRDNQIDYMKQL